MIFAFGIAVFSLPNSFLVGGMTGVGRIVNYYLHIDVTIAIFVLNCFLFIVGLVIMGRKFAMNTLVSSMTFPIFLNYFSTCSTFQNITTDLMVSALYSGALSGLGVGLVIRLGGSTGGMDIPPIIIKKKFEVPVAICICVFDTIIMLGQAIFANSAQILYGILGTLLTTIVLNQVLVSGTGNVQVTIISEHSEMITKAIHNQLDLGTTYIPIVTGYNKHNQHAVMCIISSRELNNLNQLVKQFDELAFIIINSVRDVHGRGFSLAR